MRSELHRKNSFLRDALLLCANVVCRLKRFIFWIPTMLFLISVCYFLSPYLNQSEAQEECIPKKQFNCSVPDSDGKWGCDPLVGDRSFSCQYDQVPMPPVEPPPVDPPMLGFKPDENGLIKIPLAACDINVPDANSTSEQYAHSWEFIDNGVPDTNVWLQSLPESGVNMGVTVALSPKINCPLGLTAEQAGDYTLWIRGEGDDASSDSVNYGINEVRAGAMTFLHSIWSKDRQNSNLDAKLLLAEGEQNLTLWMREDGTRIFIAVLTKDPNYVPKDSDFDAQN